jgi:serine/threonine protein phosphatase PrpC
MAALPPASRRWRTEAAAHSHVGRVRKENQDAYGVFPELGFFVVADGLGGHRAGEVASRMAVDTLRETLASTDDDDLTPVTDPQGSTSIGGRRLVIAVEEANRRIRDASRAPAHAGMGSTVAAVLFDEPHGVVAVCHVGDSRVFRVRGGVVEQLTEDHTVVQQWVREGRMAAEDAQISPHRHMITQALGTQDLVRPALRLERPQDGDVYVLTSDGIHDLVTSDELGQVVSATPGDLAQVCARLVELANERGGRDNATAIAVRCDPP